MDANKLFALEERTRRAEEELKRLLREKKELDEGHVPKELQSEAMRKAISANNKLKYQLHHLKQAMENEAQPSHVSLPDTPNNSIDIMEIVSDIFSRAIARAFPGIMCDPNVTVPNAKVKNAGTYQCNAAMQISKLLKEKGTPAVPRNVAQAIIENLPSSDVVAKAEVAGPGFINVFLHKEIIESEVTKILHKGLLPPMRKKLKVLIDFSSPNIAKDMHVGHLRSTIIGDCIARLLEFGGHDVHRINHVGDWGTQFGMLIAHLQDEYPNFATEAPAIADLQNFYKASKKRFDNDPEFKKRAYSQVVALQSYEPTVIKAWRLICDVSRREFSKIYERLDIKLEEKGESFYHPFMKEVVEELSRLEKLEDDPTAPGRKIMWTSLREQLKVPLIVVKSDGGFTYDTSDLAALRYRTQHEKADWCIYVIDSGQSVHMANIFAAGADVGWYNPKQTRVDHVGFGVVLGEDGKKFKSRSGDTVRLRDLLDEGIESAKASLEARRQEQAEIAEVKGKAVDAELSDEEKDKLFKAVAYGCIKYADLSHNRINDYVFSFDKMLSDKGNTAVYLLYASTRIKSILKQKEIVEQGIDLDELVQQHSITVEHEKEIKLATHLMRFPEVFDRIMQDLLPHGLCDYLYELCTLFNEFYSKCYCIQKSKDGKVEHVDINRLMLTKLTGNVIDQALGLLGISTVDRM